MGPTRANRTWRRHPASTVTLGAWVSDPRASAPRGTPRIAVPRGALLSPTRTRDHGHHHGGPAALTRRHPPGGPVERRSRPSLSRVAPRGGPPVAGHSNGWPSGNCRPDGMLGAHTGTSRRAAGDPEKGCLARASTGRASLRAWGTRRYSYGRRHGGRIASTRLVKA